MQRIQAYLRTGEETAIENVATPLDTAAANAAAETPLVEIALANDAVEVQAEEAAPVESAMLIDEQTGDVMPVLIVDEAAAAVQVADGDVGDDEEASAVLVPLVVVPDESELDEAAAAAVAEETIVESLLAAALRANRTADGGSVEQLTEASMGNEKVATSTVATSNAAKKNSENRAAHLRH